MNTTRSPRLPFIRPEHRAPRGFGLLAVLLVAGAVVLPAFASWDPAKPANNSLAVSSDIRSNWQALERTVAGQNLVADNGLLVWAAGDTAAPTYYTLSGAGAAVARTGAGMGDTSQKWGKFGAKVTSAAALAQLYQTIIPAASWDTGMRGLGLACGGYVKSSTTSTARLYTYDGTTTTYSSYHTGDGSFQWLTVTTTVGAAVSGPLTTGLEVATGTKIGYLQALTCVLGDVAPKYPQPSPAHEETRTYYATGNCATTAELLRYSLPRAAILRDVQLHALTAPATQALIVDHEVWDGSTWQSAYSASATRPQLAASTANGGAAPDGTYRYRSIGPGFGTSVTNGMVRLAIDQCGTGTVGANVNIQARYLVFDRPLEQQLAYNE